MCGIAGTARIDGRDLSGDADTVLSGMAGLLAHRGPDEERLLRDGPVGMVFQRLSLVDLDTGAQPLTTEDGSLVLIANGEVYNHVELAAALPGARLRTRSDCEVLLHLYRERGLRFLDDVRGMFALVLWDRRHRRLILARDRFGIKPLYYARDREHVSFASEIKALFADPTTPRRLDWERALTHQALSSAPAIADPAPTTWFEGVEQVLPGTIVEIDLSGGAFREHRYWELPRAGAAPRGDLSDAEYVRTFGDLLAQSVDDCATADVRIGLFLSGGVDSAAVAALAAGRDIPTFTVLSGSTLVNGDARSANLVARRLGLANHQVVFDAERVPGVEEWKRLLWLSETPQCGPEAFYKYELHRFVKQRHPEVKAMLLGAAADEYAGGYSADYAGGGGWDDFVANLRWMGRNGALRRRPGLAPWWDTQDLALLTDDVLGTYTGDAVGDPYADFVAWKFRDIVQYNCWHEDRTAAGNGVEARVPFLDHRLVELVASIPPDRRRGLLWDKRIIREAVRPLLPASVVDRPKVPFYHGDGVEHTHRVFIRMLAADGAALVEEALAAPTAARFLHAGNVHTMLRQLQLDPRSGHVEFLLRLINLGLLETLTLDPPGPHALAPRAAVAQSLDVADFSREREIAELVAPVRRHVDLDTVVGLHDDAMLVHAPGEGTWFLVVDGSIQFVVDEPNWLGFLRALDGPASVRGVLGIAGLAFDAVRDILDEAVELGVLVAHRPQPDPEPATEPDPEPDTVPAPDLAVTTGSLNGGAR